MSAARALRQQEILDAAAIVAAEHGYHGMSMRELARVTNQSLANLYNYFPSKDEVLFSLQAQSFETLCTAAEGAPDLHAFILNHVRFTAEHPVVMKVLVHEAGALPPGHRKVVRALKERYFQLGQAALRSALPDLGAAELERVTWCLFGMLNWSYAWYDASRHGTPEDVARTIHRLALHGGPA